LRHASPLPAMLRRAWLAGLPSMSTEDVPCAAGSIAGDEHTLYALLGHAQRLGAAGPARSGNGARSAQSLLAEDQGASSRPYSSPPSSRPIHRTPSVASPCAVRSSPTFEVDLEEVAACLELDQLAVGDGPERDLHGSPRTGQFRPEMAAARLVAPTRAEPSAHEGNHGQCPHRSLGVGAKVRSCSMIAAVARTRS
jgi:hypothetical protein